LSRRRGCPRIVKKIIVRGDWSGIGPQKGGGLFNTPRAYRKQKCFRTGHHLIRIFVQEAANESLSPLHSQHDLRRYAEQEKGPQNHSKEEGGLKTEGPYKKREREINASLPKGRRKRIQKDHGRRGRINRGKRRGGKRTAPFRNEKLRLRGFRQKSL